MATTVGSITATQKRIRISAALGINARFPIPLTIDSEHVMVNAAWQDNDQKRYIQVDRGQDGTTPATHTNGATLTAGWGGGGGSISATDGQIVYMDGTDAVGSADLTWVGNALGMVATENGTAQIIGIGPGVQLLILAADGDATHVGGELSLESGGSAGFNGGQINIVGGADSDGGDGGPIVIHSGSATTGGSGEIAIVAGGAGTSATGGNVHLRGGIGQTGNGGDVLIAGGTNVSGGTHGQVEIYGGGSSQLEVKSDGIFVIGGVLNVDGLPTANPVVAGQLWNDAGTLKVSAG